MPRKKGAKKGGKKRVGASRGKKNDGLMLGLGVVLGMLGTVLVDSKLLPRVKGVYKGGGEVIVGAASAWYFKPPIVKGLALGMLGWGATRTITSLTGMTISGVGCNDMMNGYNRVPAIGGNNVKMFPNPSAVGTSRRERISTLAAGGGGM